MALLPEANDLEPNEDGVTGVEYPGPPEGYEPDTTQRYEYCELNIATNKIRGDADSHIERINKLASKGWEVHERLTISGTTNELILRRPVSPSE